MYDRNIHRFVSTDTRSLGRSSLNCVSLGINIPFLTAKAWLTAASSAPASHSSKVGSHLSNAAPRNPADKTNIGPLACYLGSIARLNIAAVYRLPQVQSSYNQKLILIKRRSFSHFLIYTQKDCERISQFAVVLYSLKLRSSIGFHSYDPLTLLQHGSSTTTELRTEYSSIARRLLSSYAKTSRRQLG